MNPLSIIKYGKYFTNARFLRFMSVYGPRLAYARKAAVLFFCLRDKDTPRYVKAVITGVLGYLILPIDIIPDGIPFVGALDDIALIAFALKIANKHIKEEHREKAKKWMPLGSDD